MTHVTDRTQQMQPVPEGASARVETTEEVRVTMPAKISGMGHRMKRKEDPRFIQGHGNYVDDVKLPGMLFLDIVRSPYAHAKILKIDASQALATPGSSGFQRARYQARLDRLLGIVATLNDQQRDRLERGR